MQGHEQFSPSIISESVSIVSCPGDTATAPITQISGRLYLEMGKTEAGELK